MLKVKVSECSYNELLKIALKCGFTYYQGSKHCKIKKETGDFITIIPRHNSISKHTVKGILQAYIKAGAEIKIT